MAGGIPNMGGAGNGTQLATLSSSAGVVLTANSSANTKGSYTQIIASTATDCTTLVVWLDGTNSTGTHMSCDIAVGASGSEFILIHDLMLQPVGPYGSPQVIPLRIPAGNRVAARIQSTTGSDTVAFMCWIFDGEFISGEGFSIVDTYGFSSSTTKGTVIDPGGTGNTKGSWTQVVAATTADIAGIFLAMDVGSGGSTSNSVAFDVGIGASGSETVIISNVGMRKGSSGTAMFPDFFPLIPISIPNGTRLAARAQSSITTSPARTFGLTIYGVRG
jgi:hypothetical protein